MSIDYDIQQDYLDGRSAPTRRLTALALALGLIASSLSACLSKTDEVYNAPTAADGKHPGIILKPEQNDSSGTLSSSQIRQQQAVNAFQQATNNGTNFELKNLDSLMEEIKSIYQLNEIPLYIVMPPTEASKAKILVFRDELAKQTGELLLQLH